MGAAGRTHVGPESEFRVILYGLGTPLNAIQLPRQPLTTPPLGLCLPQHLVELENTKFPISLFLTDIAPIFKICKNWLHRSRGPFGTNLVQVFRWLRFRDLTKSYFPKKIRDFSWTHLSNLVVSKSRTMCLWGGPWYFHCSQLLIQMQTLLLFGKSKFHLAVLGEGKYYCGVFGLSHFQLSVKSDF